MFKLYGGLEAGRVAQFIVSGIPEPEVKQYETRDEYNVLEKPL